MTGLHGYAEHFTEPEGYLDFARYGPPSREATEAAVQALAASARPGHGTVDELLLAEPRARAAAARLAGTDADHVVLLPSTSAGLFHAAFGIPAGTVLVPAGEFPGNAYPWRRAAALGRAAPRWLPGRAAPDAVRAALTGDVVAVSVSAVDFRTGYRADLGALRDVIGGHRLLIVDAIQAFGAADLDWTAADMVVTGGQKWLRASWSTGFAAVSDRALERLEPALTGYAGVEDAWTYDDAPHPAAPGAPRFAMADPSPVTAAALAAALEVAERMGVPAIESHIAERVDQLIDTVLAAGGRVLSATAHGERAGIVSFDVPGTDPAAIAKSLSEHGVAHTAIAESIRLSAHASTPLAAVDRVHAALSGLRGQT